ncbi:NIPSNAP family protein [Massilia sp. CF038]|uniref:NIPSNAP family protein n=1 Tax=Massilia sp. CF038 TaxID=1881045 RepID=UPI0015B5F255|nr:NIPSNAP family protein [Massilia sp. CF038]
MSARPVSYPVIELRRYTLRQGSAGPFARYFETWFPEAFQQLGALALGHFVERGAITRFTWLRAYPDMAARLAANTAFYDGPVWQEHRATLNHFILDSDDVLLLRPLYPGAALPTLPAVDPVAEPGGAQGLAVAHLFQVADGKLDACAAAAETWFSAYGGDGLVEAGVLATLNEANNFPRHPVRTDGTWLVWIGILRDEAALAALQPCCEGAARALTAAGLLAATPELLVLDPGQRSRLRWMPIPDGAHDTRIPC